jgi:hypothetical protein
MSIKKNSLVLFLYFLVFNSYLAHSQEIIINGKVVNAQSNQPLPFVNITVNEGLFGGSSDMEGKFSFKYSGEIKKITFSCIGYQTFVYPVSSKEDLKPFERYTIIKLYEKSQELKEVVIQANGVNPAHRLIKLATQYRSKNNPQRLGAYSYKAYHKFYMNVEEKAPQPDSVIAKTADSADIQLAKHLENHHLFLSENVSEFQYKSPNLTKETILANRVSGFQNPSFLALSTNFQEFNLFKDFIQVLNKSYLNPISKGSTEKYDFSIQDTLLALPDTIYVINFKPLPDTNFEGLKGTIYLNTKQYALQNLIIESVAEREDFVHFRLQQKNEWVNGQFWFPSQTHVDFYLQKIKVGDKRMIGFARTQYLDTQINPPLKRGQFDEISQEINNQATTQSQDFWQQYRVQSLDNQELNTYVFLDSVGRKNRFDRLLNITQWLGTGRIPMGKLDFDLRNALKFNRYEGFRFTAGFFTNQKFNNLYTLGAYLAYGTKDGNFKYGFSGEYRPTPKFDLRLGGLFLNDVIEPGNLSLWEPRGILDGRSVRNVLTERMDKVRSGGLYAQIKPLRNSTLRIDLNTKLIRPAYAYQYIRFQDEQSVSTASIFRVSELGFRFRYAFGERYLKLGEQKFFLGAESPVLAFNYLRGLSILGGEFDYHKFELALAFQKQFRKIGTSHFDLIGGLANGSLPYPLLFNGRGLTHDLPVVVDTYFQTMELYEFASDRFWGLFLRHNFGKLLFRPRTKWFQPELVIAQNLGWGSLAKANLHQLLAIKTLDRGFIESGIQINNLLRFNYLDTAYFGLGIGAYYRYGAYGRDTFSENLALKLTTMFSF